MGGIHETTGEMERLRDRKKERWKERKDGDSERWREREQENKSYMRLDFLQVPHIGYLILVASLSEAGSHAQSELQYKKCLG